VCEQSRAEEHAAPEAARTPKQRRIVQGVQRGGDESQGGGSGSDCGERRPTEGAKMMFHGGFWFFEN
jgi:hypothetical protein